MQIADLLGQDEYAYFKKRIKHPLDYAYSIHIHTPIRVGATFMTSLRDVILVCLRGGSLLKTFAGLPMNQYLKIHFGRLSLPETLLVLHSGTKAWDHSLQTLLHNCSKACWQTLCCNYVQSCLCWYSKETFAIQFFDGSG
jgi:hypothetical protein